MSDSQPYDVGGDTPKCSLYLPKQALDTKKVLSAPVLDLDDEYTGCLSVNDILRDLIASALICWWCGCIHIF